MEQIYISPDEQMRQAKERMERLQAEAMVYELDSVPNSSLSASSRFSWRKSLAGALIRIAKWLEPTLQTPSMEDVKTSLPE